MASLSNPPAGLPDHMMWTLWHFLARAPTVRRLSTSVQPIASEEQLEELMSDSRIEFAAGLVDAMQAASPPTLSVFKALPSDPKRLWAVYAITLEKAGCRPKVYIGSGTHSALGVASRWKDYDDQIALPILFKKAFEDGYTITSRGLMCWAPIPPMAIRFSVRQLFLVIETLFSIVFWTMEKKDNVYHMPDMCPWSPEAMEYDGCCSHVAFFEGLREGGAKGLTPEQLETYEQERIAATREFKKQWIAACIAEKRFYCQICDHAFVSPQRLDDHLQTEKHLANVAEAAGMPRYVPDPAEVVATMRESENEKQRRMKAAAIAARRFACEVCNLVFGSRVELERHFKRPKHIAAAAAAAQGIITGPKQSEAELAAARVRNQRYMTANINARKYYCAVCDKAFGLPGDLVKHLKTQKHADKAQGVPPKSAEETLQAARAATKAGSNRLRAKNRAAQKHRCESCDCVFRDSHALRKHFRTQKHLANAAAEAAPEPAAAESLGSDPPEAAESE